VHETERPEEHPDERLIRLAVRDAVAPTEREMLESHLAACATCAAEVKARRLFRDALARDAGDDVRDRAAVERVMARITQQVADEAPTDGSDEELDRVAVDRAMARLGGDLSPGARRRRLVVPSIGLAALAAVAAAIALFVSHAPPAPQTALPVVPAAPISPAPARSFVLADGSEIAPDDGVTPVEITEQTPARTTVRLSAGSARFRVRHDVRRLFRVDAGPIAIEDLGTLFRVAHEPGGRVRVTVSEGRVAVISAASRSRIELGAGDDRVFPAIAEPRHLSDPSIDTGKTPLGASKGAPRTEARAHGADDAASLLAAADVARRSRSPRDALAPLRRLVERYPRDPRAPSAAFTLGWVLLNDLNRPREAAVAFADAERIAPRGALAEDAAARVAEAWRKANEPQRAAAAARHYAQTYPAGRYGALMRGLTGEN
jgi:transmembrane sensor